jgi:hypothetical protein
MPAADWKKGRKSLRITLEIGVEGSSERRAEVRLRPDELATVHLHLAAPEHRNRTGLYMRRHGPPDTTGVAPNQPLRDPTEPPKLLIADHVEALRQSGAVPQPTTPQKVGEMIFGTEPALLAVPVSDVVANLMRPAFHRNGLGPYRLFFLEGEPIGRLVYWCMCLFEGSDGQVRLEMRGVRFDPVADRALGEDGRDLLGDGLVWAVALVPLVVGGNPLSATAIAQRDYDLRQLFGRDAEEAIRYAYEGFGSESWDARVAEAVTAHERGGRPFATFYHSALALDRAGNLLIRQVEGTLPGLAAGLAADGVVAAGLLDSGGSCALYDVWLGGYLNHGWYFREPRGAILLFQLTSPQRLPPDDFGSWKRRR